MKMHQCPVCPKSFPSPSKLKRHYVIHTGQKPFNCNICEKSFTQSEHLKIHSEKVHHPRPPTDRLQDAVLTCNQQPSYDKPATGINTHCSNNNTSVALIGPSSVVSQPEWKWDIMGLRNVLPSFENETPPENMPHVNHGSLTLSNVMDPVPQEQVDSANIDTSAHNGYTCKVCFKSFTSSLQLQIHSPTHNKPKQLQRGKESGQASPKTTNSKMHLQSQEVSSSTSKMTSQHRCPKCLKTFVSPSKLQRHFLIHTGQKPFSCTICCKTFRQKIHLKNHIRSAKKCAISAGIQSKKQGFYDGRQTSCLKLQSSLQHRTNHGLYVNSSVELELECKISVNAVQDLNPTEIKSDEVVKPEQPLNTPSHKSDEQEQLNLTNKDLKPFQCTICSRSFRLEVNLIRHQEIHRKKQEWESPTTVQQSDNVEMSDSEAMKHSPEPSHADPIDLNIIVKPETPTENCSDHSDSLPQDPELITPAEQQMETCHATSKQQRINILHDCHTCSKGFPSLSKLERHMMTHTGQRPFSCEECGKRFRQKTHLRVHYRTHLWSKYHKQRSLYINRPPSRLGVSNTRTTADVPVQEMLIHQKSHSGSDVVSVKHLDRTSSMLPVQNDNRESNKKLLPHISKKNEVAHWGKLSKVTVKRIQPAKSMQNANKVQHKCFQCFKCFPSASKLQRHEMVHTGLKPFQCLMCGKAFRQAIHLKNHEQTHRERKQFKPVDQQGNIRKLRAKSQQQLRPRTSVCIRSQRKSVNVDTSESNARNGYTCKVCLKSFTSFLHLLIHSPTHSRVKQVERCRDSGQTFSKDERLQSKELSSSTSKVTLQHQCPKCPKTFCSPSKLQRHFLIHTGQKPYLCKICCKTFRQKVHLKNHLSSAKNCSPSAGTEKKKRFCDSRQTSGLQPQSPLRHRPTTHRTPVNSSEELELECKRSVNTVQDLNQTENKSDEVVKPVQLLNTHSHRSDAQEQQNLTHKDLKPFQCTICHRSFRLEVNLTRHQEIHRNQTELGSPTTVKMSDSETHSQSQSICHESDEQKQLKDLKPFQCVICNRSFRLEVNLIRHQEVHRNQTELGSPPTVQQSDNVKMSDSEALKHSPEHSHADPIDLNIIVKPETPTENCSDHSDSLPQDPELITPAEQQREICHATSKQQRMNTSHDCHTCSKGFPSLSKLERHMMTHTGQRPFSCEVCGKRFRQKTHLRVHFRTHLWSKYHKQRSLYINRPPSRIGVSNTRTTADVPVQEMSVHKKNTGSDVVSVKILDQTSSMVMIQNDNRESDNRSLQHISKKNFRTVSKVTVKRTQPAKSKQNPGKVQHKCFQCSKCFPSASKLQRHEMVHTGLKPFQCLMCGKAFRQAIHLKNHERTHHERKQSKAVHQHLNIRKVKAKEGEEMRFHLKVHEQSCRQSNRISHEIQDDVTITNPLQEKCTENLIDGTDFTMDATGEQPESHYTSVGHYSFTDADLSYCSEPIDAEWLAVPEVVSLQEENNESDNKESEDCNQASDSYSSSFPSELAFEINKLVQSQNMTAPPLSHEFEGNAHYVEVPCQSVAVSDSNELLCDELVNSVVENKMHPDNYLCESLSVFECNKCTASFKSENDLKQHICSRNDQSVITASAQKNRCDLCFKCFVSPSKLQRHFVVHTGQRPYRCDICSKTFTQAGHERAHRLTH